MSAASQESVLSQLQWRYATKKFDATRKISASDWSTLEQAVVLSPSSYGLQPWKFLVVTDPAVRKQLQGAAYNQPQIVDASHLVVFCSRKNIGPADVERLINRTAAVRNLPIEALSGYRQMMLGSFAAPGFDGDHWCTRQVYLALGIFLSAAAMLGIDACPMEGFEPAKFDSILNLPGQGYSARVLATAGYRAADDPAAKSAKVRFPLNEVVERRA